MFLESTNRAGWIEVVCGSMFSGKTEELIRRLKRAQFARQKVEIFKPKIDVRYSDEDVVSHDANTIRCTPVENSGNILLLIIVLFSQHHQFIIIRQTMGMMGQIPATDTDRMYFRHIFGHSHQIRHRPERFTGIIHIQPSRLGCRKWGTEKMFSIK